jgi:hypothetical protein
MQRLRAIEDRRAAHEMAPSILDRNDITVFCR